MASILLGVHLNVGHDLELKGCHVGEVNVQRKLLDGVVEGNHLLVELPEGVDEEQRVVPAILAGSVTGPRRLEANKVLDGGVHVGKILEAKRRDEREARVGVVVVGNDGASGLLNLRLLVFLLCFQQIARLDNLLLGQVVSQGISKVECLSRIILGLLRVQDATRQTDEEVTPESAVVLHSLGDSKLCIDRALVGAIVHVEVLLLENDVFLGRLRDGDGVERRRQRDGDVDVAVLGPDGGNLERQRGIGSAFVEFLGSELEGRDVTSVAGDDDGLSGLGVVDNDALLVLGEEEVEAKVDAEVEDGAKDELVEIEALQK